MADGDLAYSHVAADSGALLCSPADNALLFRRTRTFWTCSLTVTLGEDFPLDAYDAYVADYNPPSWATEPDAYNVHLSRSGNTLSATWIEPTYGTDPPYAEGEHTIAARCWRRYYAGRSGTMSPLTSSGPIPWGGTYGNRLATKPILQASTTVTLTASGGGLVLSGTYIGRTYFWVDPGTISVTLTMAVHAHNPRCPHIH